MRSAFHMGEHEMKKLIVAIICSLSVWALADMAFAADRATAAEAVALVKKAVASIKENGKEKAFAEFNNPNGRFTDRELYILVQDLNGKMLAHGANPRLIGKNMIEARDVDGKYFVKEAIDLTVSKGKGWVDFKMVNPVTSDLEHKSGYFEKVEDLMVGSGIYKTK